MTITIVAINAKEEHQKSYFDNITKAWDDDKKGTNLFHLISIKDLQAPADEVIIFHPRASHNNPDWFTKDMVEDFMDFDFPEDKYYVFGDDGGHLLKDITRTKPEYKTCRFIKIPLGRGYRSIHAHLAVAVVLWERFKRRGRTTSITDW